MLRFLAPSDGGPENRMDARTPPVGTNGILHRLPAKVQAFLAPHLR
jgi:hypothetical protein